MPLQAVCPKCETSHKLADEKLGKKIRCKSCKEPFTVEAEEKAKPASGGVVEVACPHCEATLRLRPDMLGKKVRCKKCQEAFTAKTDGDDEDDEDDEKQKKSSTKVTATPPKGKASAARKKDDDDDDEDDDEDDDDDDDDDDDPKSKKGKKKKKGGSPVMMYSIVGGVGALLIVIVVVVILMTRGGDTNNPVVAKNDAAKTDDKKKTDDNKIVNPPKSDPTADGKNPTTTDKAGDKAKTTFVVDPKDPVVLNLKNLRLDIVSRQAEINVAIRWFRDDPKKTKLNHPLRREISDAFQLLVDHPEFKLFDDCWYCYTDWVTSDDEEVRQLEVHLPRAPKTLYRELMMQALARIKTEESCRVLATTFPSQEHALAVKLFRDIGPELGAKPVFPYVYFNDKFARDAAYGLLKGYSEVERKELKNGVVVKQYKKGEILKEKIGYKTIDEIPRLPVSKHELSLEKAIEDVKGDDRLQRLSAIDFLQKQLLKAEQWEEASKVLDPFITDRKDQFTRTNALIALERWVHKQNVANLCAGVVTPALKDDHMLMLTTVIKVPDKDSGKAVLALYIDLKFYPEYRVVLEPFLLKLGDEDTQRELLRQFNAKDVMCRDVARKGILKFQKENKRITDDDIIEQCHMDLGGDEFVSPNALSWLRTATFHSDRKKRSEIFESLIAMTKDTSKENAAKAAAASAVMQNITAKMQAAGVK